MVRKIDNILAFRKSCSLWVLMGMLCCISFKSLKVEGFKGSHSVASLVLHSLGDGVAKESNSLSFLSLWFIDAPRTNATNSIIVSGATSRTNGINTQVDQGHFYDNPNATEQFLFLLAEDIENNDDEFTPFELGDRPKQHRFNDRYIDHSSSYYRSLHDCNTIPLYTLHHSWKSFID